MVHNILVFNYSSMMTYLSTYHIYRTSLPNRQAGRIHLNLAAANNILFSFLLLSLLEKHFSSHYIHDISTYKKSLADIL